MTLTSQEPAKTIQPIERTDANSRKAHEQLLAKAKAGKIDLYFVGDSITRRWGALDHPQFLAHWKASFHGWNAANFGWGGDTVQNVLWRLRNGELDGINPKVIVVMAGTNNLGGPQLETKLIDQVTQGLQAIIATCQEKAPGATIIVMGITPRKEPARANVMIDQINERLAKLADGKKLRYLNINGSLLDSAGKLREGVTVDGLHLSLQGYQVWAEALKPVLTELLGPRGKEDQAPPATGDPQWKPRER